MRVIVFDDNPTAIENVEAVINSNGTLSEVSLDKHLSLPITILNYKSIFNSAKTLEGEAIVIIDLRYGFNGEVALSLKKEYQIPDSVPSDQIDGFALAVALIKYANVKRTLIVLNSTGGVGGGELVDELVTIVSEAGREQDVDIRPAHGGFSISSNERRASQILSQALQDYKSVFPDKYKPYQDAWDSLVSSVCREEWHSHIDGRDKEGLFPSGTKNDLHNLSVWDNRQEDFQRCYPHMNEVISEYLKAYGISMGLQDELSSSPLDCWQLSCLKAVSHTALHRSLLLAVVCEGEITGHDSTILASRREITTSNPWKVLLALRYLKNELFHFQSCMDLPYGFRLVLEGNVGNAERWLEAARTGTPRTRPDESGGITTEGCFILRSAAQKFDVQCREAGNGYIGLIVIDFGERQLL